MFAASIQASPLELSRRTDSETERLTIRVSLKGLNTYSRSGIHSWKSIMRAFPSGSGKFASPSSLFHSLRLSTVFHHMWKTVLFRIFVSYLCSTAEES